MWYKTRPWNESPHPSDTNRAINFIAQLVWRKYRRAWRRGPVWYKSGFQLYHTTRVIQIGTIIRSRFPRLASWHNSRGIVSWGCLQKWTRTAYVFYTFRIPTPAGEKGNRRAYTFILSVSPVCLQKIKNISPTNFVTQFPRELCHEAVLNKKRTEEDTSSTHVVSLRCLMKKGKRCGFTFTLCVSTPCLQKVIQSRFLRPASWHKFRGNCVTSLSWKRK